jgi:hypothetical protein
LFLRCSFWTLSFVLSRLRPCLFSPFCIPSLHIDDLSCNDPFTTRASVLFFFFRYLLVTLTTPLLPRRKESGPSKNERSERGRSLADGDYCSAHSPWWFHKREAAANFINCTGRRKVCEPVRPLQFRPQSPPIACPIGFLSVSESTTRYI